MQTQTAQSRRDATRIERLLATRRWCYFIPTDAYVEGAGFRVSLVFEKESGHFPTGDWPYEGKVGQKAPWFWGHDLKEARAIAEESNEKLGISAKEAAIIVASSMGRSARP